MDLQMHPKLKQLRLRASPVTYSNVAIDSKGELVDDTRVLKGYLIAWGIRDSYGTKFLKGCCAKSIRERGPESQSKSKIIMLWHHHQDDPIGTFAVLQEDDYGLYFETNPLDDVASANRAITQVRSGTINQFSVGFDYIWDKIDYDESDDSLILKEIDLFEGSPVSIGSNSETYAMRSPENLEQEILSLNDETEDFIKSIPRKQQLELRQLITRHKSLAKIEPQQPVKQPALEEQPEPVATGIDYQYLRTNLNLFK